MDRIVVLGAGELGGLAAHAFARRTQAREIYLVDEKIRVAQGKALDIMQAAPLEAFSSVVVGAAEITCAAGATAVVLADQAGGSEWQGEAALALLKRVSDLSPGSIVVCAGSSQRDLVERAVREHHVPRNRIIGSAPEAVVAGVRAIVAADLRLSPADIAVSAVGVPPDHIVVPWDDATIGGFPLHRVVNEPTRRRFEASVSRLWPPGPYALASTAAKVIDCVIGRSDRIVTCFIAPDDTRGLRSRAAALPIRLGNTGLIDVVLPELNGRDRVRLENAMLL